MKGACHVTYQPSATTASARTPSQPPLTWSSQGADSAHGWVSTHTWTAHTCRGTQLDGGGEAETTILSTGGARAKECSGGQAAG